jgi:hypothetical protein
MGLVVKMSEDEMGPFISFLPFAFECVTFSGKRKKGGNDNKK